MLRRLLLLLLMLPALAAPAGASELARFHEAVADAYHHYKAGLFYLRTGNPAVAGFEIAEAARLWDRAVLPFADRVPDAFADDAAFAGDLTDISARLRRADSETAAGDTELAAASLEPVRTRMSALRQRNGLIGLSDRVDAANAAMDRLWAYRQAPPDWTDAAAVQRLDGEAAVTAYLYGRLRETAPAAVLENDEFRRIVDAALSSLEGLRAEILARDEEAVINYLRELRSLDRILWLQFG